VLPLGKEDLGEAMGEISTDSSVVDEASTSTSASASIRKALPSKDGQGEAGKSKQEE
jgi:hypothetical protein